MPNLFAINTAAINTAGGAATQVIIPTIVPGSIRYLLELIHPGGEDLVPMSSWQATLQTDGENFLQAVIPNASPMMPFISTATGFTVIRAGTKTDGSTFERVMADAEVTGLSVSRGPTNYSVTLRGSSPGFIDAGDPSDVFDRDLEGIQQLTIESTGTRVRCDIDWLLQPGQRAYADGSPIIVSYINYYVNNSGAFMEVGERN